MTDKRTIGWGIIGTGPIAHQFAQGLSVLPDARLIAVGSRQLQTAQAFAREFNVPLACQGYTELINNPDVDVVYIATPNSKHYEHCLLCLNAGKAVLCEKPFALNARQARTVIELARAKRIFCMEAMWMRFMPLIRQTRDLITEGAIGQPLAMRVDFGYPVAFDPQKHLFKIEMGGGALLDRGVYGISLAVYLFGKPSSITGVLKLGDSGVDETSIVTLEYLDQMVHVAVSFKAYFSNEAVISGSLGRIRIGEPFFRPHWIGIAHFSLPQALVGRPSLLFKIKERLWVKKSYLRLSHFWPFLKKAKERERVCFFEGNGYNYEAMEVMNCLSQRKTESDIMPLADSLIVMNIMDHVRKQNNYLFPGEAVDEL